MKTDRGQHEAPEWTGYKVATFVISTVSLMIILSQAIYNNYYVQRWKEIEFLQGQLDRKRQEYLRNEAIPGVRLTVNTLKGAGFSNEMLIGLQAVPSGIQVRHARGDTAKGIFLEISSSEPILEFKKWESPETFSVARTDNAGKTLKVTCAQLRKGASIGLTILSKGLAEIKTSLVLDLGELLEEPSERGFRLSPQDLSVPGGDVFLRMSYEEFRRFGRVGEEKGLRPEIEIAFLEKKIESIRSEGLLSWVSEMNPRLLFAVVTLVAGFGAVGIISVPAFREDRRKRAKAARTLEDISETRFVPRDLADTFRQLGLPDSLQVRPGDKETDIDLVYFSGSSPESAITFLQGGEAARKCGR